MARAVGDPLGDAIEGSLGPAEALVMACHRDIYTILCTVGYDVPSSFAAFINEIILPSPAMTSSIIFVLLPLAAFCETLE